MIIQSFYLKTKNNNNKERTPIYFNFVQQCTYEFKSNIQSMLSFKDITTESKQFNCNPDEDFHIPVITGRQMAPVYNKEPQHQLSWHLPNVPDVRWQGPSNLGWVCLSVHAGPFTQTCLHI